MINDDGIALISENIKRNCKNCIGCQKLEQKDFKEVHNCSYFKSAYQELQDRKQQVNSNIMKYAQVKI